jgi:hypothetical protein
VSTYSYLVDRPEWTSVARACKAAGGRIASFLSPRTAQEQELRRAHLVALLLVAAVATAKHFSGLTDSAPFSLYVLAVAVSAFVGGFAPACVATLAAVVLANAGGQAAAGSASRIMFLLEGMALAGLVSDITRRLRENDACLAVTRAANDALRAAAAAQDLSRRRETEAFRDAALHAQLALQKVADDAQRQVAALESLADPLVNPIAGLAALDELIEQLRSTMHADGVAVVQLGQAGTRVISGAGLHAQVRAPGVAINSAWDGRVALVHNDAAHVAQVGALTWPATVSSIMVVPVGQTATGGVTIEVVTERRTSATEWDLALARIVADRLARAIAFQIPTESGYPLGEDARLVVS